MRNRTITNIAQKPDSSLYEGAPRATPAAPKPRMRSEAVANARHLGEEQYLYGGDWQNLPPSASDIYSPPVEGENIGEDLSYAYLNDPNSYMRTRDQEFARARLQNKRSFMWDDKRYHTGYAGEATPYSAAPTAMGRRDVGIDDISAGLDTALQGREIQRANILYNPRKANRMARREGRQENRAARQEKRQGRRDQRAIQGGVSDLNA